MGFLKRLRTLVVEQRCMPWRVRIWLGKRWPKLLVFLQTGRTNINTPEHWDAKWEDAGPDGARWCQFPNKFARICELIGRDKDVLDVGCGVGLLLEMLRDRNGCRCSGGDISPRAVEMAQAKGLAAQVAKLPEIPLPDNRFDAAIATELIEHLDRPELTLREMARVVRPGGLLIISTPCEALSTEDTLEHLHTFDAESLRRLLAGYADHVVIETLDEEGFEADFLLAWGRVKK